MADNQIKQIIDAVRKDGYLGNAAAKEVGRRVRDIVNKRENPDR